MPAAANAAPLGSDAFAVLRKMAASPAAFTNPDCAALPAFYTATGGLGWTVSTGWTSDTLSTDCCSAYGVTCNAVGTAVTGLKLDNNNLSGQLPDTVALPASLESFSVAGNHLSGPVPSTLLDLPALNSVDLSNNHFFGQPPNFYVNQAGSCNLTANAFDCTLGSVDVCASDCTSAAGKVAAAAAVVGPGGDAAGAGQSSSTSSSGGLSSLAIGGIVIGSVLVVAAAAAPAGLSAYRRRQAALAAANKEASLPKWKTKMRAKDKKGKGRAVPVSTKEEDEADRNNRSSGSASPDPVEQFWGGTIGRKVGASSSREHTSEEDDEQYEDVELGKPAAVPQNETAAAAGVPSSVSAATAAVSDAATAAYASASSAVASLTGYFGSLLGANSTATATGTKEASGSAASTPKPPPRKHYRSPKSSSSSSSSHTPSSSRRDRDLYKKYFAPSASSKAAPSVVTIAPRTSSKGAVAEGAGDVFAMPQHVPRKSRNEKSKKVPRSG
ncbi:hypothetical protein DFJ73DRAFT_860954 [Zopfochytrium polystomum]|nr:hypothetical protein DFJ73DRAFT_860954 [Zopfochytrium polystomum]